MPNSDHFIILLSIIFLGYYYKTSVSKYEYFINNKVENGHNGLVVYYINLNRRPDRKVHFTRSIDKTIFKNQYHRFPAIDGKTLNITAYLASRRRSNPSIRQHQLNLRGMIGCAESHMSIWRQSIKGGFNILVFEDDVIFKPVYNNNMKIALTYLPKNFDIIYFHVNNRAHHHPYGKYYHKLTRYNYSLTNYLVSPNGSKRLLDYIYPYNPEKEIDVHIADMTAEKKLNAYVFMLPTVYTVQNYTESDVQTNKKLTKIHDFHDPNNQTI